MTIPTLTDLRFRRLAKSSLPILVGPWNSELGFEISYWLPWVQRWMARYQIDPKRVTAISRGGAGAWYPAANVAEVYAYEPLAKVRQQPLHSVTTHQTVNQHGETPWERLLVQRIAHDLGIRRYAQLHPARMFEEITAWRDGQMTPGDLFTHLQPGPIPVSHPPLDLVLPERFIAVGFYSRPTFPVTNEKTRDWVTAVVDLIAGHLPVVVIESPFHTDDHIPFPLQGKNIQSIRSHMTLETNLAVQANVIARSSGFIGTYGGLLQLASRLGKIAWGFYEEPFQGTSWWHKVWTEYQAAHRVDEKGRLLPALPLWIGPRRTWDQVGEFMSCVSTNGQ